MPGSEVARSTRTFSALPHANRPFVLSIFSSKVRHGKRCVFQLSAGQNMEASASKSVIDNYLCIAPDVKLGRDVKLSKFINLYGCDIGDETKIGAFVEVQKNATIGKHCQVGGGAVILGHLTLADRVIISAASVVMRSILKPGQYSGVFPIDDNATWQKNAATLRQLHGLRDRLRALEKIAAGSATP